MNNKSFFLKLIGIFFLIVGLYTLKFGITNLNVDCFERDKMYFGCVRDDQFLKELNSPNFKKIFEHQDLKEGKCYLYSKIGCIEDLSVYQLSNFVEDAKIIEWRGNSRRYTFWQNFFSKIPFLNKNNLECRLMINYKGVGLVELFFFESLYSCNSSLKEFQEDLSNFFQQKKRNGIYLELEISNWSLISFFLSVLGVSLFFISFIFLFDKEKNKNKRD